MYNEAFLLAVTAYKILLPEWFEHTLSPQGNGILPDFSSPAKRKDLEEHLRQHNREKAIDAVRKLFDSGLLDKVSMRLIIGERVLIEQWLKAIRSALDRNDFNGSDEARIANITVALTDASKDIKLDPSRAPYADFRDAMTQRLGKMTEEDSEIQFLLVVDCLAAVSRKGVTEDWAWGTQETALRYEKCLVNLSVEQKLPEHAVTIGLLKELREHISG